MEVPQVEGLGPAIDVRPLLGPERSALVELLAHLSQDDWQRETACGGWSVHDLILHLIHDDLRRLSVQRDRHPGEDLGAVPSLDVLVTRLDEANERWVRAVRRAISPQIAMELIAWLAGPSEQHLSSLEPGALGAEVSWAGGGPHPNWLDVAREYTERWVHQQQIRLAVDRPGLVEQRFMEPVLDTFARALPSQLPTTSPVGRVVELRVRGSVERSWMFLAVVGGWSWTDGTTESDAFLETTPELLWKRAVRMVSRADVAEGSRFAGDETIVRALLDLRAAIVSDQEP